MPEDKQLLGRIRSVIHTMEVSPIGMSYPVVQIVIDLDPLQDLTNTFKLGEKVVVSERTTEE